MYCQRLARAFTGRPKILKFEGAYHGANEAGVTSLFPNRSDLAFPEPELTSAGTPDGQVTQLLVAPYNDLGSDSRSIVESRTPDELAAVIAEPLQRCTPPAPWLPRRACAHCATLHGVLLIFDEVVTGFRLAYGGAQEYYGVIPDLVAYGKALGGGHADRRLRRPRRAHGDGLRAAHRAGTDYVWMASTLGGNPVSTAAAKAALGVLPAAGHLRGTCMAWGATLRDGLARVLQGDRGCRCGPR